MSVSVAIFLLANSAFSTSLALCSTTICVDIDPSTLALSLPKLHIPLSAPQATEKFDIVKQTSSEMFFTRNNFRINVAVKSNVINISFTLLTRLLKTEQEQITFPVIKKANSFLLPMLEGRDIPALDPKWIHYLTNTANKDNRLSGTADLSMQFLTAGFGGKSIFYLINNIFDNQFWFSGTSHLEMSFSHNFNGLNEGVPFGFQMQVTQDSPNAIAYLYRTYKMKQKQFVTLKQKAKLVPNVEKLYGAPFIYLWGDELIGKDHVHWKKLQRFMRQQLKSKAQNPTHYFSLLSMKDKKNNPLEQFIEEKWLCDEAEANIDSMFKVLILDSTLWNADIFHSIKLNHLARELINRGVNKLSATDKIELNKNLIQSAYSNYIDPVDEWGNGVSLWMLKQLKGIGLHSAWLGLDDRMDGIYHRDVIKQAVKDGYLIAPYDSYNSVQKPGVNSWGTALFKNDKLYTNATIVQQNGKLLTGFLGRGHTLNSSFAMPELQYRLKQTLSIYQTPFNSWFFDTDGAGALYNDFSKKHPLSEAQDANNRLARMKWAIKHYHLVVGTEDGKDYSATVAVFGHGLVSQGIWDKQMRRDKLSKYYLGNYWSPFGIPPRYNKLAPIKPILRYIYFNPRFEVPLYALVYHDSIITSDHWEYGTLRFPQEQKNNILKTFLYNYPPLLHLDRKSWKREKKLLRRYLPVWSKWHKYLADKQLIYFSYLKNNKLLQKTDFSGNVSVIANFSNKTLAVLRIKIPGKSVLILQDGKVKQRFIA